MGDPGAGKSTLLRFIALRLARCHTGVDREGVAELGFDPEGTVPRPVLPQLPSVADALGDRFKGKRPEVPTSVWFGLLDARLDAVAGTVEEALEKGDVLLLFDSLDEVGEAADRLWLVREIRRFADRLGGNRVGLACRTRAWSHEAEFAGFDEARLRCRRR